MIMRNGDQARAFIFHREGKNASSKSWHAASASRAEMVFGSAAQPDHKPSTSCVNVIARRSGSRHARRRRA